MDRNKLAEAYEEAKEEANHFKTELAKAKVFRKGIVECT